MSTGTSDLDGLFKQVYADNLVNLIPECLHLTRDVPFSTPAKRLGDKFHTPVIVTQEAGVTYAAPGSGAFSLNSAISMKTKDAEVDAYQIMLRAVLDNEAAAKSMNGGASAFREATQLQMENMMESIAKRVEIACLYGQSGLGVADSSVNGSGTTTVVTLTTGTFATGIWSGTEQSQVQFFKTTNGDLISSAADSVFVITSIDPTSTAITFTGTATGISALDTWLGGAGGQAADIYFNGSRVSASVWNEMPGINKIVTNTGSLFGIDAGAYALWQGNTFTVSGALSLAKLQDGIALAVARGGLSEDVTVYVNPNSWADLLTEQSALRMYDSSYKAGNVDNGGKKLTFYSQNGKMEIVAHPYVKPADAFALPLKRVKRIGSTDITFNLPGTMNGKVFQQLENSAGFQYKVYTGQSIFVETPAKTVKFASIT